MNKKKIITISILFYFIGLMLFISPIAVKSATSNHIYDTNLKSSLIKDDIIIYELSTQNINHLDNDSTDINTFLFLVYVNDIIENSTDLITNISTWSIKYVTADWLDTIITIPKTKEEILSNPIWTLASVNDTFIFNTNNTIESITRELLDTRFAIIPRDANLLQIFNKSHNYYPQKLLQEDVFPNLPTDSYSNITSWYNNTNIIPFEDKNFKIISETEFIGNDGSNQIDISINITIELNFTNNNIISRFKHTIDNIVILNNNIINTNSTSMILGIQVYDSNPNRFQSWISDNLYWFLPLLLSGIAFISIMIIKQIKIKECIKTGEPNKFCKSPALMRQKKYHKNQKNMITQLEKNI